MKNLIKTFSIIFVGLSLGAMSAQANHSEDSRLHIQIHNDTSHTLNCLKHTDTTSGNIYSVNADEIKPGHFGIINHEGRIIGRLKGSVVCYTEDNKNIGNVDYRFINPSKTFHFILYSLLPVSWGEFGFIRRGLYTYPKVHSHIKSPYTAFINVGSYTFPESMHRTITIDITQMN